MTPEATRTLSFRIIDILPDAPDEAMAVLALTFANVTCSTGCSDEAAINAFRIALQQMRASRHWVDA